MRYSSIFIIPLLALPLLALNGCSAFTDTSHNYPHHYQQDDYMGTIPKSNPFMGGIYEKGLNEYESGYHQPWSNMHRRIKPTND